MLSLHGHREIVKIRPPGFKDIYESGGFRVNVTIVLEGIDSSKPRVWGEKAFSILTSFLWEENFKTQNLSEEPRIREDILDRVIDSINFGSILMMGNIPIPLSVQIFPEDRYLLEQTSILNLYTPEDTPEKRLARQKLETLQSQLKQAFSSSEEGIKSTWITKMMEPRNPPTYIPVIGVDSRGRKERWRVPRGSSVIAYAYDMAPSNWSKAISATINAKPVDLTQTLNPFDEVHIEFGKTPVWDPRWIYGFPPKTKGFASVKRNISRLERDDPENTKIKLLTVGRWKLEESLPEKERPLRVGPEKVIGLIHEIYQRGIRADEFLLEIGRGNVPESVITQVANALAPINRKVESIVATFSPDQPGQLSGVSAYLAKKSINIIDIQAHSLGKDISRIVLFVDPDDSDKTGQIIEELSSSQELKDLGLREVNHRKPK